MGKHRRFSPEEVAFIRDLYGRDPRDRRVGRAYSGPILARMFRTSAATILRIIDHKPPYNDKDPQ